MDEIVNSVRNKDGIWVNTSCFREEAIYFQKNGIYCPDPPGSPAYLSYWKEQRKRCREGYSSGGAIIPGDFYFYLNFCPIKRTESTSRSSKVAIKTVDFPDFWDGDYNYYFGRYIARNGVLPLSGLDIKAQEDILNLPFEEQEKRLIEILKGYHLYHNIVPSFKYENLKLSNLLGGKDYIVMKRRRGGFSFKNGSIGACNYFHRPNSYTMYMAYDKKYLFPNGVFSMFLSYVNFINDNTAWKMPSDFVNKGDHLKSSYKEYLDGVPIEKGFKSEAQAISFKDNPQAGIGKDCYDIMGEEVGTWGVPGGLKDTYYSMLPSVTDGELRTGMLTFYGTSNNIDKGTIDFAEMFQNVSAYTFLPFYDVWGEQKTKMEGFFFPANMNMVGHYDKHGNSDFEGAKEAELQQRKIMEAGGASSTQIMKRMREFPLNSAEALSMINYNSFPIVELNSQLQKVKALGWQESKGTPVTLEYEEKGLVAKPILKDDRCIKSYKNLPFDLSGDIMIYERPVVNAPKGLYKIGYDPVRQDQGTSLAGIIVYKGVHKNSLYHDIPVAEYIGRRQSPEEMDRIAELLAEYYSTTIMHENEVTGVKNYFRRIKKLYLLAAQPDAVISKHIKHSKTARVYGCHMSPQLKDAGERYITDWLLTVLDYDEHGSPIRVVDRIYSIRLLEELIAYNRKGNFDLVSALIMCLFQVQEESLDKVYDEPKINKRSQELLDLIGNMHKSSLYL